MIRWCLTHRTTDNPEFPDGPFCLWSLYAAVQGRSARECEWVGAEVVVTVASGEIEGQVVMDA